MFANLQPSTFNIQPLVSVVIANYNYGRFLEEAIQSVLSQIGGGQNQVSPGEVELIIIDGGSTDNSVDVIKKYAYGLPPGLQPSTFNLQPLTYWVSEPDKGQSNAFNKGFAKARGRFLTWLNADDVMLPGTIAKLKVAAEKHPECEWFVGGCFWLDPEMRIVNCGRGRPFSELRCRAGEVGVWGPSSFFTKRLLDAVGGVDERFHYSMDADLWLRFAHKAGARYRPFCDYAWGLRLHPDAKMSRQIFLNAPDERQKAAEKQKRQERDWRKESFKTRAFSPLARLLSVSWRQALASKADLWRCRGRHYREVVS